MSLLLQLLKVSLHSIWPCDMAYIYHMAIWYGIYIILPYDMAYILYDWVSEFISWWVSLSPDGMNYDRLSECISWEAHVCPLLFNCSLIDGNLDWNYFTAIPSSIIIWNICSSYRRIALPLVFSSSFTPSSVFSVLSLSLLNPPLPLPL